MDRQYDEYEVDKYFKEQKKYLHWLVDNHIELFEDFKTPVTFYAKYVVESEREAQEEFYKGFSEALGDKVDE